MVDSFGRLGILVFQKASYVRVVWLVINDIVNLFESIAIYLDFLIKAINEVYDDFFFLDVVNFVANIAYGIFLDKTLAPASKDVIVEINFVFIMV